MKLKKWFSAFVTIILFILLVNIVIEAIDNQRIDVKTIIYAVIILVCFVVYLFSVIKNKNRT